MKKKFLLHISLGLSTVIIFVIAMTIPNPVYLQFIGFIVSCIVMLLFLIKKD